MVGWRGGGVGGRGGEGEERQQGGEVGKRLHGSGGGVSCLGAHVVFSVYMVR